MGIQKYVFYSIHNCDKHPEVPLMEIKYCTENFLRDSGLNHIVIRLCGFMQVMLWSLPSFLHFFILHFPCFLTTLFSPQIKSLQGLIGQYAVPILEEKSVWGTDAPTRIAYMDTQVNLLLCTLYSLLLLSFLSFPLSSFYLLIYFRI